MRSAADAPAIRSRRPRRCGIPTSSRPAAAPARGAVAVSVHAGASAFAATRSASATRQAETGLAPELERGNHTRDVVGIGCQNPRTDEPRERQVWRSVQRVADGARIARIVGCRLAMRPGPAVTQIRQLDRTASPASAIRSVGSGESDRAGELHAVLLAHDHEAQPRPQLRVRVGARRSEQPRESRRDRTRSTESSSARNRWCPDADRCG